MAILLLLLAVVMDVTANVFLKYSNGFARRSFGAISVLLVMASFIVLVQVVETIELSVAYAIWGALGILGTALMGILLFQQRLNIRGWIGMSLLVLGTITINLSV